MAKGTKPLIERKALELFVEKGIRETTVRDIAAAAKVAEGTLYRHYPSKDALAEALFSSGYEDFAKDLAALADAQDEMRAALSEMVIYACRAFDQDWVQFSYLLLSQHVHLRRRASDAQSPVTVLRDRIALAMDRGQIPSANAELAAAMVFGLVLQAAVSVVYGRLDRPLSDYASDLSEAAWKVLRP